MRFPLPDTRGWVALGLFALTTMILGMIYAQPTLTTNQGFMLLAQAIVLSGLINGAVAFLFGSSKGAADSRDQVGQALGKIPDPPKGSPP